MSHNGPDQWRRVRLGEIGRLYCGQSPRTEDVNRQGVGTPYITGPEQWNGHQLRSDKWTTDARRVVPDGCVFITVKGAGVGKIFPGIPCAIGRDVYAYEPSTDNSARFVEHALRYTVLEVIREARGDIPGLSKKHIMDHVIGVPAKAEQVRITAKLDELFSDLDAGVAGLERARANLKRYRAAVLKAAVEGKLTEQWRAEHPDVEPASALLERILAERRQKWEEEQLRKYEAKGKKPPKGWRRKYRTPAFVDSSTQAAWPKSWSVTYLDSILDDGKASIRTGPFGSLLKKHEHRRSGVPVLGIENIQAMRFVEGSKIYVTPEKAAALSQYAAESGDILISRSGTVGEVCVVPAGLGDARISTNLMRVRLRSDGTLPAFFCMLFNGSPFVLNQISQLCSGSTRDFLNKTILTSIAFPMPPIDEQVQIVRLVEEQLAHVEHLEIALRGAIIRSVRLRQSILKEAFQGNLLSADGGTPPSLVNPAQREFSFS